MGGDQEESDLGLGKPQKNVIFLVTTKKRTFFAASLSELTIRVFKAKTSVGKSKLSKCPIPKVQRILRL